jgi:signal transduction histidine kinase
VKGQVLLNQGPSLWDYISLLGIFLIAEDGCTPPSQHFRPSINVFKKFTTLLLALLVLQVCRGQTQPDERAEELGRQLLTATDTTRVRVLNELSVALATSLPDSAQRLSKEALNLAQFLGDSKGVASSWQSLGGTYYMQGNYSKELECYTNALKIREELGDDRDVSQTLNSIGNSYFIQQEYDLALDYYLRAKELRSKIKDRRGEAVMLNNIGNIHLAKDEFKEAEKAYSTALDLNTAEGNRAGIGTNLYNLGLVSEHMEELGKAKNYYLKALNVRREINSVSGIATVYNSLGDVYQKQGDYQQAIRHYQHAQDAARTIKGRKWVQDSYEGMAQTYERMGDYRAAYDTYKQYTSLKDSLFSEESKTQIKNVTRSLEAQERENAQKLQAMEEEARRQRELSVLRSLLYVVLAVVILALGIVGVLIWRYRIKQRANNELERRVLQRTEELKQANEELNTFVYKSSHDLKSPLTSIKGLVGIAKTDPQASEKYLPLIENRVEHLDNLLSNLISTTQVRERLLERTPLDFQLLLNEAISSLKDLPGYDRVSFTRSIKLSHAVHSDKAVVATILRHLLGNAVVFASKENPTCHIEVVSSPALSTNRTFSITVTDNGIGIPADAKEKVFDMFYRASTLSRGGGLGLYIVRKSLERLDGEVVLESEEGKGTKVTVRIPG